MASSPQVTAPSSEDGDNSEKLTKFTKDARQGSIASVESKDNNSESIDLDLATNAEVVNKQVISLLDADSSLAGKEDNNKKSAVNSGAASKGWDALKRGIKSLSKRGNEISSLDEGKEEKKSSMTPFFLAAEESKGAEVTPPKATESAIVAISTPSSGQLKYTTHDIARSAKSPSPSSRQKRPPFGRMTTTSIQDKKSPSPSKQRMEKRSEGISRRRSLTIEQLGRKLPWGNTNQPKSRTIGKPVKTAELLSRDPSTASLGGKTHRRMSQMNTTLSPSGTKPYREAPSSTPRIAEDIFSRLHRTGAFVDPDAGHQPLSPTVKSENVLRTNISPSCNTLTTPVKG